MSRSLAYRGILTIMAVIAVSAVAFGIFGVYTVLTGGTGAGDDPSIIGEYQCDSFDGDPEMPHEASLMPERTVVGDSQLSAFNATQNASAYRIELETVGELINASAATVDGDEIHVEKLSNRRIAFTAQDSVPLRVFIDSASEDGALIRSEIDLCPPE